jgi:hypothetical protein
MSPPFFVAVPARGGRARSRAPTSFYLRSPAGTTDVTKNRQASAVVEPDDARGREARCIG